MPPLVRYEKETIRNAAFAIFRREGAAALNARAVAREVGSSTQPIFRLYSGMEELKNDVILMAQQHSCQYFHHYLEERKDLFLSFGQAYILYARDEPELFKLLYMRDRTGEAPDPETLDNEVIRALMQVTGYPLEKALNMMHWLWIFTHGLAVCMCSRYLSYTEEELTVMLRNAFDMVKQRMDKQDA